MTDRDYEKFEEKQHNKTERAIHEAVALLSSGRKDIDRELSDFYRRYGTDGVVTYQEARKWAGKDDHRRRMVVLFLAIGKIISDTLNGIHGVLDSHLRKVIREEFKLHGVDLSDETIDNLIRMKWKNEYGEANWSDRLNAYNDRWNTVLCNDVKTAFHTQNDLDDVEDDYDVRFKSMKNLLTVLFITETTAVGTLARQAVFKSMGISAYRFYARMDERTCEYCGGLHGRVFPMSAYEIGVTASPIHARCRCWEVPVK